MSHRQWAAGHFIRMLCVPLVMTALLAGAGGSATASATATACDNWAGTQPANPGATTNSLRGVAVLSACNAWAVGDYESIGDVPETLIEHWNGSSWKVVASPDPGTEDNALFGVRGASPTNIWAVGYRETGNIPKALILHWNGHTWKEVSSSTPSGDFSVLEAVRVVSATNAWAVGEDGSASGTVENTFVLHWNGHSWKQVRSPSPQPAGPDSTLSGVAATSGTDAWAVGSFTTSSSTAKTLILHWNGRSWTKVSSPDPGSYNELDAVGATSRTNAWAVGHFSTTNSTGQRTLILHWNGHKWHQVASPNPGGPTAVNFLLGVTATSAKNAWAVGGTGGFRTLILRWNGTRWARVLSPNVGQNGLLAVAASSASNVWAVGQGSDQGRGVTVAIHCC